MSLGKLTVNGREDGFLCDGKPFFWFADTCWSAFTSITEADWDYYLTRRAEQGMNVLQVNTLPQWDRCLPDLGIWPYASEDGVHFDWSAPNQEYWDRARRMCQAAVEHGIRPALVLMWCNYVPVPGVPRSPSVAAPRLCRVRRSVPTLPASSRTWASSTPST